MHTQLPQFSKLFAKMSARDEGYLNIVNAVLTVATLVELIAACYDCRCLPLSTLHIGL